MINIRDVFSVVPSDGVFEFDVIQYDFLFACYRGQFWDAVHKEQVGYKYSFCGQSHHIEFLSKYI